MFHFLLLLRFFFFSKSCLAKDSRYFQNMALVSLMHILLEYSSSSITTLFLKLIMGVNGTACCVVHNLLALNILVKLYPRYSPHSWNSTINTCMIISMVEIISLYLDYSKDYSRLSHCFVLKPLIRLLMKKFVITSNPSHMDLPQWFDFHQNNVQMYHL